MNIDWQKATVIANEPACIDMRTLTIKLPYKQTFLSGQYYDLRLDSAEGYLKRSYSIVSAAGHSDVVSFCIQILPNAKVSPYLFSLKKGFEISLYRPQGNDFIWESKQEGDLVCIGGGSGVIPMISMIRTYDQDKNKDHKKQIVFFISVKDFSHMPYKDEIDIYTKKYPNISVIYTLTGTQEDWHGSVGRFTDKDIVDNIKKLSLVNIYIAGPTIFAQTMAHFVSHYVDIASLHTAGFGPVV